MSTDEFNHAYTYAGYRYDKETGLYFLNARYYNAGIGRFLTKDSMSAISNPKTLNLYSYANGDPVNLVDPGGNFAFAVFLIPILASVVASAVAYLGSYAFGYSDFSWKGLTNETIKGAIVGTSGVVAEAAVAGVAGGIAVKTAAKGASKATPKYIPRNGNGAPLPLPRTDGTMIKGTTHIPESNAPHTQIGWAKGRNGDYIQTLEWGENGIPIKRTDWTDHGRPQNHTNPHDHYAEFINGSWRFK